MKPSLSPSSSFPKVLLVGDVDQPHVAERREIGLASRIVSPLAILLPRPTVIDAGVLLERERDYARWRYEVFHIRVGHHITTLEMVVGKRPLMVCWVTSSTSILPP